MGSITITVQGSFGAHKAHTISAMTGGHAQAVGEAIKYLTEDILPRAIKNDHECHRDGIQPSEGFGKLGLLELHK